MKRIALVIGFVVLWCASVSAEPPKDQADTVTIPLDQIWAYQMPGTKDIRELEPERGAIVGDIGRSLYRVPPRGDKAEAGFAVLGTGLEALRGVRAVMVEGKEPSKSFPVGSEVSVVFFSHAFGYGVHIYKVERRGNNVKVRYQFVPHRTKVMTVHFALIPLNELAPGQVRVEIIRSPMDDKYRGFKPPDSASQSRVVSQSFRFVIEEPQQ